MKVLAGLGLAAAAVVLAVLFLWPGKPMRGPEPIAYGRDVCAECRMHMSRVGFAGELRDHEGRLTKYDDVGCVLRALAGAHYEIPEAWVEDHETGAWIPLLSAHLVRWPRAETPMGYGVVAFETEQSAAAFAAREGGAPARIEDLLHDPARFAATGRNP